MFLKCAGLTVKEGHFLMILRNFSRYIPDR